LPKSPGKNNNRHYQGIHIDITSIFQYDENLSYMDITVIIINNLTFFASIFSMGEANNQMKERTLSKKLFILIILFILMVQPSFSKKTLTYEQAFLGKGEEVLNKAPMGLSWLDDRYYREMDKGQFVKVDARTGKRTPLLGKDDLKLLMEKKFNMRSMAAKTADFSKFLFLKRDGNAFLYDVKAKKLDQLNVDTKKLKNPVFSPNGNFIAYTREGNLFYYNIKSRKEFALTSDGDDNILNGYASWVYYEEILGRGGRYRAFWWSPDSKKIVFLRSDQTKVPVFPIFRAKGVYGELEKQRYPKPGFPNPKVEVGIATIADNSSELLELKDPGAKEYYLSFPVFSEKMDALYFQWLNRDQNHLKIIRYDLKSKAMGIAYEEKQKTWVDFPGFGDFFLLRDGKFVLRSSASGWDHLYIVDKSGKARNLTSGSWSVTKIHVVNQKRKRIYFSARKEDSTELDCYSIDFDGKRMKRLTQGKGFHMVSMSKNGSYFMDRYSNINTPFRLALYNHRGRLVKKLWDMYKKELDDYALAKVEMLRIKTSDGYELPAVWYLPHDFDKSKKYPVVINVYGGPGSTSVYNMFSFRSPLRRHFMANQGMIVMSVDHRGSGHFGKKGMDLMHRKLGEVEMKDYIEVVEYLRGLPFVDGGKIGITGGSYGGYVTALALTKHPEYFNYGIADFSVTDWRLYDSVYTERYMDLPSEEDNKKGYDESNVMSYIDKYKGGLRITHGTMDDNVHCQNTIQFIDKVLDAGKSVELMLYPGERHGFRDKNKRRQYSKANLNFWFKNFFGKSFE
jgi:dipeptidyl-peptidase-4